MTTTKCPNGHDSTWADYCSVCGELLGGTPAGPTSVPREPDARVPASPAQAAQAPASSADAGPTCSNCNVARHEHDVFCESCGYDFASGSLPEGPDTATGTAAPSVEAAPMHVKISVDADFFAASVGDAELTLPDPLPAVQIVPLAGIRILIGRQSTSRGIFPEIDVQALTDDPAVSSRHAMLERDVEGSWTLTDLGSTNGTFLTAAAGEEVASGTALLITAGTSIFLGAWTRIELADSV